MAQMKKRFIVILVALLVLAGVVGAVVYSLRDPAEFTYKGKPLNEWIIALAPIYGLAYRQHGDEYKMAEEAILMLGTNAVPTLLKMLRAHDSGLNFKLELAGRKLGLIRKPFVRANEKISAAEVAFRLLGSHAGDYVPDLVKIYEENFSEDSRFAVIRILSVIGPRAAKSGTPVIVDATTSTNPEARHAAIAALWHVGAGPEILAPAYTNMLNDPYWLTRRAVCDRLEEYGDYAKPAIPALLRALQDTNSSVRDAAANAIKHIDGETYWRLVAKGKITDSAQPP